MAKDTKDALAAKDADGDPIRNEPPKDSTEPKAPDVLDEGEALKKPPKPSDADLARDERAARTEPRVRATDELTEDEIRKLGAADLRAIALQRGYRDFPQAGRRTTQAAFIRMQNEDPDLTRREKGAKI